MRFASSLLVLALGWAAPALAVEVVWETGAVVGSVTRNPDPSCPANGYLSTGTFNFDSGDEELAGVDYFAASPGTFQVCAFGSVGGTWSGDFGAFGVDFGTTTGTYQWLSVPPSVGSVLQLDGPITFSAPGYPPLPPELTNLRMTSSSVVTSSTSSVHFFQGVFELKGDVPAVCGDGLVTGPEGCDDSNTATGGCCDATCQPEPAGATCNVGPGGVCNGLGSCIDPDDLESQSALYGWLNCDVDFSIVGPRGHFSNPELGGIALAVDPVRAKLYTGGRTLTSAASTDYTRPAKITRTELDGSGFEDYYVFPPSGPDARIVGFGIDAAAGQLFFSSIHHRSIGRISLTDPTDVNATLIPLGPTSVPVMLAVDEAADKVYWHDASDQTIRSANTDGSNVAVVIAVSPWTQSLAVDPIRGKLYWAESNPSGPVQVRRANLDGSSPETVSYAPTPTRFIYDIDLDASANVLYLAESLRNRQLDITTGAIADSGDVSCPFDRITLDPSARTSVMLPGGTTVSTALLGGPSAVGGLGAAFGQTTAGSLNARFQRVSVATSTADIGVDLTPIAGDLASAPAQVWQMAFTGSLTGPFTIVIRYDETAIGAGIDENDLQIRAWDGSSFVLLPGTVDTQLNRITVVTDTLPTVAILGTASLQVMGQVGPWGRVVMTLTAPKHRCSPWRCFQPWHWFRWKWPWAWF